jgi:pimeloyl-ACP methyl ester carboxylesterase
MVFTPTTFFFRDKLQVGEITKCKTKNQKEMRSYTFIFSLLILLIVACSKEEISISTNANDSFYIENKGATMPVWVRGNTASGIFVVILHGGPGGNAIQDFSADLGQPFIEDYALVLWDQRNAGSTQGNANLDHYTLSTMNEDLQKLLMVIRHRYGQQTKIFLFSHSFGGTLAVNFLTNNTNQSMVSGWVNVDGAVDWVRNDTATQNILIKTGEEQIALGKNVSEWQDYVSFAENNDPRSSIEISDQMSTYGQRAQYLLEELNDEDYGDKKLVESNKPYSLMSHVINGFTSFYEPFRTELFNHSPTDAELSNITLPVLQIYGRYDFITPLSLGLHLNEKIGTPTNKKDLLILGHSAHNPFASEPELFYERALSFIESNL